MTALPTAPPIAEDRRPPSRSSGRIALLTTGAILALIATPALVGGGYAAWAQSHKDQSGYLSSATARVSTDTHAIVAGTLDVSGSGLDLVYAQGALGIVRIVVSGPTSGGELFVGVGPTDAVSEYLGDVQHDVVDEIEVSPFDPTYIEHQGTAAPEPPGQQSFWALEVQGEGAQTLTWEVQAGDWSVVLMNADGSAGIAADVSVAATLPIVKSLATGLLIGGTVLMVVAVTLLVIGFRRPRG